MRPLLFAISLLPACLLAQGAIQPCSIAANTQLANGATYRPAITPDARWIAFSSTATNLVANDTNGVADVFLRNRTTGSIERVTVDTAGTPANGDSWATGISDDGRFVLFLSLANNLVPGDTNGVMDGFVRDRLNNTTRRVTIGAGGVQATAYIDSAAISGDGSTVAFGTASPLVPGDTNGQHDVFVLTLATGAVERASVDAAGNQGNGGAFSPSVSVDGRFVTFHSTSNNLVANDTNAARDIFVRDRQTATIERISTGPGGIQSNADSRYSRCNADGQHIAFISFATNLVPGDTNGTADVFVHDRTTGVTDRVSVSSTGSQGTTSITSYLTLPAISAQGRYVAFYSQLDGLAGPINATDDAFVHDRMTGRTMKVSRSSTGTAGNATSGPLAQFGVTWLLETMAIASDPPIAVFSTEASNLVPWDSNASSDVFAVDIGLRCVAAGPAVIGGAATVDLAAESYPNQLFVGTFSATVNTGVFLPGTQWLPLDPHPLVTATLSVVITDASGDGSWSVALPAMPALVGVSLQATALRLDFAGPTLFPAIGNVVTFVIQ